MKEYVLGLLCICLTAGIVRLLSEDSGAGKYVELVCSLCVVAAIVIPVVNTLAEAGDASKWLDEDIGTQENNYEEIYKNYLLTANIDAAEDTIRFELAERFSKERESIDVRLDCEHTDNGIEVIGVSVMLGKGALTISPEDIKIYIKERFDCRCQIIYV